MHLSGFVASSSTTDSIASCTGAVDSTIAVGAIDSGSTTIVAGSIAAELESITATRVAVGLEFPDSATKLAVDPEFLDSAIRVGSNLGHSD